MNEKLFSFNVKLNWNCKVSWTKCCIKWNGTFKFGMEYIGRKVSLKSNKANDPGRR